MTQAINTPICAFEAARTIPREPSNDPIAICAMAQLALQRRPNRGFGASLSYGERRRTCGQPVRRC